MLEIEHENEFFDLKQQKKDSNFDKFLQILCIDKENFKYLAKLLSILDINKTAEQNKILDDALLNKFIKNVEKNEDMKGEKHKENQIINQRLQKQSNLP